MPEETLENLVAAAIRNKRAHSEDDKADEDANRTTQKRPGKGSTASHSRRKRTRQDEDHDGSRRETHSRHSRRGLERGDAAGGAPDGAGATPGLDDDAIFREALFDALSDSAGAEYWEKLYGQPIHVYPRPVKVDSATGEEATVDDLEYVAYVRRKMWEKTHEGHLESLKQTAEEQRRRRREDRERQEADEQQRADERRKARERRRLEEEIDRSLRRAEERRKKTSDRSAFERYSTRLKDWDGNQDTIPWPTETGRPEGITERSVRSFFLRGLDLKALGSHAFNAKLKEHRVRWHPDKMEQKMGGRNMVDERVMVDITMAFQVIDTLFNDTRENS